MACRVEHLDAVRVSIPLQPEQVAALGAVMDRYQCVTVAELASHLVLQAVQAERHRALLLRSRQVLEVVACR